MKGRIAPARLLRPAARRARARRWPSGRALTGRRYGLIDALPDRGRRDDPRRDGHDRRHRPHRRRPPARRRAGGSGASPSPASDRSRRRARRGRCGAPARSPSSSGPTSPPPPTNPLTRELKAGARRASPPTGVRIPRVADGVGRARLARRRGRRPGRRVRLRSPTEPTLRERPYARPRDPPPARARARRRRPPTGRRLQPARPLDRRVRLGHDEQARGDARRRAVRPARPGLPALRLGEEGPADDLLPDDRRRADPRPRRARPGRVRAAPRRQRRSASATRSPASSTAARSSSRPPLADPEAIWASIPAAARAELVARRIRVTALDTASLARAHAPRPDLLVRMQGVALVGVFLRVAPFAARAGLDRDAAHGGGPRPARPLLRQARRRASSTPTSRSSRPPTTG